MGKNWNPSWIRFYTGKWLFGSGREMTPEKRAVWADLMALVGETKLRDGALRFDVGRPMSRNYIANVLQIGEDLLDACIAAFKADINSDDGQPRLQEWDDGTLYLTNFVEMQGGSAVSLKSKFEDKARLKDVAKDKARKSRSSMEAAAEALTREINRLNKEFQRVDKKLLYVATDDGMILNTQTGEKFYPEVTKND